MSSVWLVTGAFNHWPFRTLFPIGFHLPTFNDPPSLLLLYIYLPLLSPVKRILNRTTSPSSPPPFPFIHSRTPSLHMGCSCNSVGSLINPSLLISLLLISSTQVVCLVKGMMVPLKISKHFETYLLITYPVLISAGIAVSRLLEVTAKVRFQSQVVISCLCYVLSCLF